MPWGREGRPVVERPESLVSACARILPEVLPGTEILDRDLAIGPDRRVPLVLADPNGRLVLALPLEESHDAALLLVLDALAFAQEHGALVRRHVEALRVDVELSAAVWAIARDFSPEFLGRLRATEARALRVLRLVTVESRRGSRAYLQDVPMQRPARASDEPALFDDLPPERRELAQRLVRRIERLDEELEPARDGTALVWRLREEPVCALQVRGDGLEARLPDDAEAAAISNAVQLERFLERAVERYLALLRGRAGRLGFEPHAAGSEPLLTPEELAAFDPTP
jgi:hypothetical protein